MSKRMFTTFGGGAENRKRGVERGVRAVEKKGDIIDRAKKSRTNKE